MFAMNRVNPTAEPRSSEAGGCKKYYKEEKYSMKKEKI